MTLPIERPLRTSEATIAFTDWHPLDTLHIDIGIESEDSILIFDLRMLSDIHQLLWCPNLIDSLNAVLHMCIRLDGSVAQWDEPTLHIVVLIDEVLVDGDIDLDITCQHIAQERRKVIALDGDVGLEVIRGDEVRTIKCFELEVDRRLLRLIGHQIVHHKCPISRSSIIT